VYLIFLPKARRDVYSSLNFFFSFVLWVGARLGVGAPLPETPAVAQTRLVQKLEGGKKRLREVQNGATLVRTMEDEEADSAEESRVGTIRKRARIDPFEPGVKKKKKAMEMEMGTAKGVAAEDVPRPETMAPVDAFAGPVPKRKKKKKKALIPDGQGSEERAALGVPNGEGPSANHGTNIAQREGSSMRSPVDEWDGPWKYPHIGRGDASASGPSSSGMFSMMHPR
jgi:hypothetical protein